MALLVSPGQANVVRAVGDYLAAAEVSLQAA
jgi:hypothetical protein